MSLFQQGEAPDTEIGRVYVDDPDDWDLADKRFMWLPSYEQRSPYFDIHSNTGMITMKEGTPNGTYLLRFNVSTRFIYFLDIFMDKNRIRTEGTINGLCETDFFV